MGSHVIDFFDVTEEKQDTKVVEIYGCGESQSRTTAPYVPSWVPGEEPYVEEIPLPSEEKSPDDESEPDTES